MKSPRGVFLLLGVVALGLPGCAARQASAPPPPPVGGRADTGVPVLPPAPVHPRGADAGTTPAPAKKPLTETNLPVHDVARRDAADRPENGSDKLQQLGSVYFPFGLATLDDAARKSLERVYRSMSGDGPLFRLEGYCDGRGSDEYNLALGQARAQAVQTWLETRGMAAGRLATISYGLDYPADPGDTEAAYARNRRVEILHAEAPGPSRRNSSPAAPP